MKKEELLYKYGIIPYAGKVIFSPRATKSLSLPSKYKFGVEVEFLCDKSVERDLEYNFTYYNTTKLGEKWRLEQEYNGKYPDNVLIKEFISPILGDDISSLDQLNVILQLVKAFEHPVLKTDERNMHFHFDMNLLGESLEYLRPFLKVFRAYENIIFRIATSETGKIRKEGISDRIAKALKEEDISDLLKAFNNGEYSIQNLLQYRKLPINLFNVGAFYEAKGTPNAAPGVISQKITSKEGSSELIKEFGEKDSSKDITLTELEKLAQMMDARFVYNTTPFSQNPKYSVLKTLTPTFEFRLTPSTYNLGFVQQHFLLYSIIISMARNLSRMPELQEKVDIRNKMIDEKGPQIFDVEYDEGIEDIIGFLPSDLGKRLLVPYVYSDPVKLYDKNLERE